MSVVVSNNIVDVEREFEDFLRSFLEGYYDSETYISPNSIIVPLPNRLDSLSDDLYSKVVDKVFRDTNYSYQTKFVPHGLYLTLVD
jgi:hypothetical protein